LTPSSAPLADLCSLLGIATTELAAVEGAHRLAHTFTVKAVDAARLDSVHVQAFIDVYGEAAFIELLTGDLPEIVLKPGVSDSEIAAFAARAASGGPYRAAVHIDKARLAQQIVGTQPARTVRVFLFAEALRRSLAGGIARFEAEVWPEAPAPLILAVLDSDVALTGPHFSIFGGPSLSQVQSAAAAPPSDTDFKTVIATRDRYIGWDVPWTRALTPWHFELAGTCENRDLHGILRAQLVKLAVLFTCDRARNRQTAVPPPEILAEYRGRDHVAVISIDESASCDADDDEIAAVLWAVSWCYERSGGQGQPDWVSDRLPFVQTRIAEALEPSTSDARLAAFIHTMPYMIEGIKWQWKAFIEGRVGEYLDRVQQVEAVVGDTVAGFTDRTLALVKSLTDAVLAAVAVLIGSFVAAAFSTPFNATLFRIGVLTYAGYLLLFPGLVGLIASASSLRAARAEFTARINRFDETLFPGKVNEIVARRVDDVQSMFFRWLVLAAIIYVAVSVAAAAAAVGVPDLILANH
jgi:hypothetical protein